MAKKPPQRPCSACHEDEATMEVEQWEDDFRHYCTPCGTAMVSLILEARGVKARFRDLEPFVPSPPTEPPAMPSKTESTLTVQKIEPRLPPLVEPVKRRPGRPRKNPLPEPKAPKPEPESTVSIDSLLGI